MSDVLPWLDYKWSFEFPVGMYRAILERMRGTSARLEEMLEDVPREALMQQPNGKWSVLQQAGHLWVVEALHHGRIEQYLRGERELVAADMTNRRTQEGNFNEMPREVVLAHFRESRMKMMSVLDGLTLQDAARTAFHPRLKKELRLADLCFFAAEHDDHHLAVIRAMLRA
ncbi:MAG: DinB family protein [Chloroflexota bacterium]